MKRIVLIAVMPKGIAPFQPEEMVPDALQDYAGRNGIAVSSTMVVDCGNRAQLQAAIEHALGAR